MNSALNCEIYRSTGTPSVSVATLPLPTPYPKWCSWSPCCIPVAWQMGMVGWLILCSEAMSMLNYPFDQKVHPYLLGPFCYNLFCKAALQRRGKGKKGDKNRPFNGSLDVSARWQGLKRWGKSCPLATLHNEPSTALKLYFEEHHKITFFSFFLRQKSTVIPGQGLLLPFVQLRIFARESQCIG